jgi:hypothetical protein
MSLLILINGLIKRFLREKGIPGHGRSIGSSRYFSIGERRIPFEAGNDFRVHECLAPINKK